MHHVPKMLRKCIKFKMRKSASHFANDAYRPSAVPYEAVAAYYSVCPVCDLNSFIHFPDEFKMCVV